MILNPITIPILENIENILWGYIVLPILLTIGLYFSYKSRFLQFRRFPQIFKSFIFTLTAKENDSGIHPLKAFFTCIGGPMGVGNVVAVCTAVQIGGPGALLWIWITAFIGMILKYSEVYLGMRYRVPDGYGGYRGGPMYFLQGAFKNLWIPKVVCFLLCLSNVEIYQFSVVTESIATNLNLNKYIIALSLMSLMIFVSRKGVNNVGRIASIFIPICIISYLIMGSFVILKHIAEIPSILMTVIHSAFNGHSAVGGFVGSTILITASQGMRRCCYSGDLGIGYASVIHSETRETVANKQASLTIIEIFLDSFVICTLSILLILITGVWNTQIDASMLVQAALAQYYPGMHIFMPAFLLILGFTTIISYFCAGIKCAEFMAQRIGRKTYYVYAFVSCLLFVWLQSDQALTVMSINAAILLLINISGIYKLRHQIDFQLPENVTEETEAPQEAVPLI